jgi:hypothetical protein
MAGALLAEALALPGAPKPLAAEIHLAAGLFAATPEDAEREAGFALRLAAASGHRRCEASAHAIRALSHARRGRHVEAAADLALARAALPPCGLRFPDQLEFAFMEAEVLLRGGEPEEARRVAADASATAHRAGAGGILRRQSELCLELQVADSGVPGDVRE